MRVADARSVLEDLARSDGQEVETLTPPEAVGLMVRFYSEIRADDWATITAPTKNIPCAQLANCQ